MRWQTTAGLLRAFAIAIALAAVLDPAVTSNRSTRPEIAVVAASSVDSSQADRVARSLSKSFTVSRAVDPNAAGTVLVGSRVPERTTDLASPIFVMAPDRAGPTVTIDDVHAPSRAPSEGRVPISVVVRATNARGRSVVVSLRAGDLVVDRVTRSVDADDAHVPVTLSFLPTAPGAASLRVSATIDGTNSQATTNLAVDVRDTRWAVLFFDPRPSWMSTFVRRALERDPRFVVTSRVVTSRNVSTDVGRPPAALDNLAALELFDAVVVGAPEALRAPDIDGLEGFLRRRGGSVVLLFDRRADGAYNRLTYVNTWRLDSTAKPVSIAPLSDNGALRASEIAWPAQLPPGAEVVAGDSATARPVVWRSPVGAGQLVVSGALDSWRFRDPALSSFDRFWLGLIANTASRALPAVTMTVASPVVAPGERGEVRVFVRDAALSIPVSASAVLEGATSRDTVQLWPDGGIGELRGSFHAPTAPGVYRIALSVDADRAEVPVVVAAGALHPSGAAAAALLGAWAKARGGDWMPAARLGELPAALRRAIRPAPALETWNPMRAAWWILPFALALSGEWWLRRRHGLP